MDTKSKRVVSHRGLPHLAVTMTAGKKSEHPVTILVPPSSAKKFDEGAMAEGWRESIARLEDADVQYRALEGAEVSVCHRTVRLCDFKIVAHGLGHFELVLIYFGDWAGVEHVGTESFRSTRPDDFPAADKVIEDLKKRLESECDSTHGWTNG